MDNSPDTTTSTPACIKNFKKKIQASSRAEVKFVDGTDLPIFNEGISYFGTSARASAVYDAGVSLINNCKDLAFTANGNQYTISIGAMSFPKVGERSAAWQMTLTVQGYTAGFDVVVSQKGKELNFTLYGDIGTPDLDTVTSLVTKAVSKMPSS